MSTAAPRNRLGCLDDEQLMQQVSAGSTDALGELYDRHCHRAYRVARAVCGDEGPAHDAVQEGFLSMWNSPDSYRSQQGTVIACLLTVVRNRATDLARGSSKHHDARRLQAALAMLPETQAEVVTLAYYGQLTHIEIAAQLGLPAGTVKGRMRLGLQQLQKALEQKTA